MLKGIHQQLEPHSSPAFFVRGSKPFSRLMFFCSVSLLMMAADARFDYLNQLRQGFSAALHPLEVIASAPNEWGRNINTYFTSHNRLIQENFELKQQAVFDHAALQRLATVEAENAHLRTMLAGDAPVIPEATLGEILHMGRDPFSNIITLNRGSRHYITPGQAVVDANGVVGQITRVYPFTSEVTLITDKKLSIPILIERNQLRAIAFGEGKRHTLDIPYLPTSVDIKVGDKLVTSGIDGVYPAGLAVATVSQIKQSQDSPFAKIISTPVAEVSNHKHVLILKMPTSPVPSFAASAPPVLPHANAQHLDQSVVEILQNHNAAADPVPAGAAHTPAAEPTVASQPSEINATAASDGANNPEPVNSASANSAAENPAPMSVNNAHPASPVVVAAPKKNMPASGHPDSTTASRPASNVTQALPAPARPTAGRVQTTAPAQPKATSTAKVASPALKPATDARNDTH